MEISAFRLDYFFLSNSYPCTIQLVINDQVLSFSNAEAAFQAFKCPEQAESFTTLSAQEAKKHGRSVALHPRWDDKKLNIMDYVVYEKFRQNTDLRRRLIETGDTTLVAGNTWNDTFWGVCYGKGENHLGHILEATRTRLRGEYEAGDIAVGYDVDNGPVEYEVLDVLFPAYSQFTSDKGRWLVRYKVMQKPVDGQAGRPMLLPTSGLVIMKRLPADLVPGQMRPVHIRETALPLLAPQLQHAQRFGQLYATTVAPGSHLLLVTDRPQLEHGAIVNCVHAGCVLYWDQG